MSERSVSDLKNYQEVIADIAFTAGHLHGKGKLEVSDSRQLMSNIASWAEAFERVFDHDQHGDDYMELVDEYAMLCLTHDAENVAEFLDRMRQVNCPQQP